MTTGTRKYPGRSRHSQVKEGWSLWGGRRQSRRFKRRLAGRNRVDNRGLPRNPTGQEEKTRKWTVMAVQVLETT